MRSVVSHIGANNTINTVDLLESIELPLDVLTSSDNTKPLSAKQGKVLKDAADVEASTRSGADTNLQNQIDDIHVHVFGELPTVTDGIDYVADLAHTPVTGSVRVYFNGELNLDVVVSQKRITFVAPLLGTDVVMVDYIYITV
jgi:hypothetical protein